MPPPLAMNFVPWCLGAFLCGSIPFGLILIKLSGKGDVREQGSGNIGATNVSRVGGKALGILTLFLDVAKGYLPVFFAKGFGFDLGAVSMVALCAVAGHIFTPWLKFKGGKGVATALGVALAFCWPWIMPSLLGFLFIVAIFRYVSLASMVAALLLPITMGFALERAIYKEGGTWNHEPITVLVVWSCISILLIAKHHANIRRLIRGQEPKLWGSKEEFFHV